MPRNFLCHLSHTFEEFFLPILDILFHGKGSFRNQSFAKRFPVFVFLRLLSIKVDSLKFPPHLSLSLWKYAPAHGYIRPLTTVPPKIKLVAAPLLDRVDLICWEHEALAERIKKIVWMPDERPTNNQEISIERFFGHSDRKISQVSRNIPPKKKIKKFSP